MNEFQVNLADVGMAMMRYHYRHGVFPASFNKLGQSMLCGSETHAIEVRPRVNAGAIWHPQQCEFTYRIVTSGAIEFRVDALNSEGRVVDTLRQRWSDLPAL